MSEDNTGGNMNDQKEKREGALIAGELNKMGFALSSAERTLVRDIYAKGANDLEFDCFLAMCKARRLNPFSGQIFLIPFKDEYGKENRIPVVSIHGLTAIAARTGDYAGATPVQFLGEDDEDWVDVWDKDVPPRAARIGVYTKGVEHPTMAVATWKQSAKYTKGGGLRSIWKAYPADMLEKCALAKALRRLFPDDAGGIYIAEEFGHEGIENLDHSKGAATAKNENQTKARATAQGKYSDADICNFGKKHKGRKWCEIEPEYFDWILSNVDDNPDVIDRVKWEIDKRAGKLEPPVENGDIQDVPFEDDGPQNEEDERKVLNATIRASKDILPDATFQQLCGAIAKAQDVKHLSDVDTPGLREMDKLLTEAVNEQLEGDDGET